MSSSELQDISQYCDICHVPSDYESGKLTLDQCRDKCAYCNRFGGRIYKFDIAYTLRKRSVPFKGKGKTATRKRQYGEAVANLTAEGKTVREIAKILGISPTTVVAIRKETE